ncbi:MAG TPA: M28 family peptidase [Panacibacter sp.]|nr:M28 family peptidase [Panacibacter sp.]HNP43810.1 M28 family peptidase [Panacibacter sp.]
MKNLLIVFALLLATGAVAQSAKKLNKSAAVITAADLKSKLSIIAGAEMEGRETATPGQKKAAAFIENYFKSLGLQPGMPDGSYQMQFTVYQDSLSAASVTVGGKILKAGVDYTFNPMVLAAGQWTGDTVVFAGFGLVDSLHNDYKDLPIKGNWVLIAEGKSEDADKPAGTVAYSFRDPASLYQKMMQARNNGAKGVFVISKELNAKNVAGLKGNMYMKKPGAAAMPVVNISYTTAASMIGAAVPSFAAIKSAAPGAYASSFALSAEISTNTLQSSNVIAVLPGTSKKDEYVFITGHYDHLGKRDSVIYYGADDDGSGTTSVLELAEAFTKAKKKGLSCARSIVFMTVSGEEKGLWGSEYYAAHPVFPLNRTSVDLNIDMVGRIDPDRKYGDSTNYVYTIGEDKLSSDLLPISDSINSKYMHMELDRKYNDPKDPNRFYYRSDHYNFAKNGVPVIFYFNGTHADYHRPTDTVDKINFNLMEKRVRLVFYTAYDMANRAAMLKRDIPLK